MNKKLALPALDDDLAPRRRLNLRSIQAKGGDDDTVAENSRRLGSGWGAQTTLEAQRSKTKLASLRIEIPEYLDRELSLKAVELRVTKQFLVTRALKDAGFHIAPEDLVADKRKARR